jgi:hypothetical protein
MLMRLQAFRIEAGRIMLTHRIATKSYKHRIAAAKIHRQDVSLAVAGITFSEVSRRDLYPIVEVNGF